MRRALVCALAMLSIGGCESETTTDPMVGTLERDRVELIADAREAIVEIAVTEGDVVAAGQLLLRLDPAQRQAELDVAEAQRAAVEQRLAELVRGPRQERIREARARLAGAQENFVIQTNELERVERLVDQNLASASALDRARNAREAAEADVDARSAALDELLVGTTSEELAQAEARLNEAEARVELARIALDRLEVHAAGPGSIDALPYELGERPPVGVTVVVMLAGTAPFARIYVPEPVRARVMPGIAAEIRVDGVDGTLSGRVRYVASDPVFTPYFSLTQRDRSRLAYLAEVTLTGDAAATLPSGLPVEVTFPTL